MSRIGLSLVAFTLLFGVGCSESEPERKRSGDSSREAASAVPELGSSEYRNASLDVAFVGSKKCAECHAAELASYRQTSHSKALGQIDPASEPAPTEFFHSRSGRWYRVSDSGETVRHRESLRSGDEEIVLNDCAMTYAIGSGTHSRSYLYESDGFLMESPITWYASRQEWGMSPGYDAPHHAGFGRLTGVGCLHCHAGRVEAVDGNSFRPRIHEMSIGCESCHGPGALHVELRERGDRLRGNNDDTIVNPARLSRRLQEDVCANCHLRGEATVLRQGRRLTDFRPGLSLTDVRVDYGLESPDGDMKVVGHVAQMRLSACYSGSETLTCITCHDPHSQPQKAERAEYFRGKCLTCHESDSCGLPHAERHARQAGDNCIACHMPKTDTDIPHFSFTHHRIAVHDESSRERPDDAGIADLVPISGDLPLQSLQRDRLLGLAYLEYTEKAQVPAAREAYQRRARQLLESVHRKGLKDAAVEAGLARIYWESNPPRALNLAGLALSRPRIDSEALVNALFVSAELHFRTNNASQAQSYLKRLTKTRRHSEDWLLLGLSHHQLGDGAAALESLEKAARISPSRPDIREILADLYRQHGDERRARRHERARSQLLRHRTRKNRE